MLFNHLHGPDDDKPAEVSDMAGEQLNTAEDESEINEAKTLKHNLCASHDVAAAVNAIDNEYRCRAIRG